MSQSDTKSSGGFQDKASGAKSSYSQSQKYKSQKYKSQRRRGLRSMGAMATKAAQPALRKQGFAMADLIVKWPHIIGERLAAICQPKRLVFPRGQRLNGVLHCQALGAWALELQHQSPLVIERINSYFGYQAVVKISLSQGYFDSVWRTEPSKKNDEKKLARVKLDPAVDTQLTRIENAELRKAMRSLAQQVTLKNHN